MTGDGDGRVVGRIGMAKPDGLSGAESEMWDVVVDGVPGLFGPGDEPAVLEYVQVVCEWQQLSRYLSAMPGRRRFVKGRDGPVETAESKREHYLGDRMVELAKRLGLLLTPELRAAQREYSAALSEVEPAPVVDLRDPDRRRDSRPSG